MRRIFKIGSYQIFGLVSEEWEENRNELIHRRADGCSDRQCKDASVFICGILPAGGDGKACGNFSQRVLTGIRGAGPLLGAVLGCVPQCGFSVLAANLFSGGMISAGTLLAVFLSTSDEAILMIMGQPESAGVVGKLLFVKVVIAVLAGYLIDFCFPKLFSEKKEIHDLCEKESCGCGHSHG